MATQTDVSSVSDSPKSKKIKLDEEEAKDNIHTALADLSDFKLDKILHNNTNRKHICLQGSFENCDGPALVILEKTAFAEDNFINESEYFTVKSKLKKIFHNDIYGNYECFPKLELNSLKATIIHPATAKHIEKYSIQNIYLVDETYDIYQSITLPHLTQEQLNLQWVYNILEHKSEADRIVFEDTDPELGFTLIPDLKWDGITLDTLYLLAIVQVHGLKSLRDLTEKHLPLLKNIKEKGENAIKLKYNLDSSQLRTYVHYQPSFYHFHIHFTYLKHEAPGITAERSHLLSNIISNIKICPNYYQKVVLPFTVRESDKLFKKFEEKGHLSKLQKS